MNGTFIKSSATGLAAAAAILAALTAIGGLIAQRSADPDKLITPLAYAILAVSSLAGGATASRKGDAGPAAAALCGAMISILHLILHAAFGGELMMLRLIATYAGIIALSFVGGLLFRRRSSASAAKKLRKLRKRSRA